MLRARHLDFDFLFLTVWLNHFVEKVEIIFILLFEQGLSNEPTLDPELDKNVLCYSSVTELIDTKNKGQHC